MVCLFTRTDSSKFMDSKMRPLWCVWQNQDESGHDIYMMYKNGDGRLVFLFTRQTPSYRRTQKMFSVRVVVRPCCRTNRENVQPVPVRLIIQISHTKRPSTSLNVCHVCTKNNHSLSQPGPAPVPSLTLFTARGLPSSHPVALFTAHDPVPVHIPWPCSQIMTLPLFTSHGSGTPHNCSQSHGPVHRFMPCTSSHSFALFTSWPCPCSHPMALFTAA